MIIEANAIKYFVEVHQQDTDKPDLVMLHGFMGSGRSFRFNIPLMKSYCNPITIDLLGYGQSDGAQYLDRLNLKYQLSDLQLILKNIPAEKPYVLGYSMGGRLALRYALAYPASISGLVLESTNYGMENQNKIKQRKQLDEKRATAIEQDFKSFLNRWEKLPLFRNEALPNKQKNHYAAIQRKQNPRQMANSLRGFGTAQMPSAKNKLDRLEPRVLLLAGEHDEKYTNIMEEMHQLIPENTYAIIKGAGHRVHLDKPNLHSKTIKKFITKT